MKLIVHKTLPVIIFFLFVGVFLLNAPPAGAFFLTDWFTSARNFVTDIFSPDKKEISVDSSIEVNLEGDVDQNGEIDSGDIVTFSYTILNPTKDEYPFATLLTNIPRNNLNFIHDVRGTASLSDENSTITIPNLRIPPQGEVIISFNARINYSPDELILSTEPELVAQDQKSLVKTAKKEVKAKPWKKGKIPGMVEIKQQ